MFEPDGSDALDGSRYNLRRRPHEGRATARVAQTLASLRKGTYTKSNMATVASARMPDSPSSSPRLPSPPPMPEFQFGPQSPSVSASTNELQVDTPNKPDESAQRRIRPGTKAADMAKGPPLVSLTQVWRCLRSLKGQLIHFVA